MLSRSFIDIQSGENFDHLMHMFPAQFEQCDALPSYFSSHAISKYPFLGY